MSTLAAWAMRMMLMLQPAAPWVDTYESTAIVLAEEAVQSPLFRGDSGSVQTLSLFLSVAWFESRFDPHAQGDCKEKRDGKCISTPQSLCMFQIGRSNLAGLNVSETALLSDVRTCTRAARTLMKISFGVCRDFPRMEILGHYASGGSACGGLRESRHRMAKADWIFTKREP